MIESLYKVKYSNRALFGIDYKLLPLEEPIPATYTRGLFQDLVNEEGYVCYRVIGMDNIWAKDKDGKEYSLIGRRYTVS